MGIIIAVACLGARLNVALFVVLSHRIGALPRAVWKVAKAERTETEERAFTVLQEAAAIKVGALVIGLRSYHDQMDGNLKAQVADAEVRARVAEPHRAQRHQAAPTSAEPTWRSHQNHVATRKWSYARTSSREMPRGRSGTNSFM
jgi:hypothetical protein